MRLLPAHRYLRSYEVSKKRLPKARDGDWVCQDSRLNNVYKRDDSQLIRFSDYHPKTNSEAFFYQVLLRKVAFRDEAQLISESNAYRSYLLECQIRDDPDRDGFHILHDEDDLNEFVQDYCERHMYRCVCVRFWRARIQYRTQYMAVQYSTVQ